jgi:hypothetical protein
VTDLQTQIESSTSDDVWAVLQRHFELMRTAVGRGWIEGDWT